MHICTYLFVYYFNIYAYMDVHTPYVYKYVCVYMYRETRKEKEDMEEREVEWDDVPEDSGESTSFEDSMERVTSLSVRD